MHGRKRNLTLRLAKCGKLSGYPVSGPQGPMTLSLIINAVFAALVILAIAVAFSNNRRAINWSTVAWGLSLQIAFALIVLLFAAFGASASLWVPLQRR